MTTAARLIPLSLRVRVGRAKTRALWPVTGFGVPAPQHVKLNVLRRYGYARGTWVETGTYLGDTTHVLARQAAHVYTIEPSDFLAERARGRFKAAANVEVCEGLSEHLLPGILDKLSGPVSFWLDGHASGGLTHTGPQVTPIREELANIQKHLESMPQVAVFVDDFRGFGERNALDGAYPSRSFLVHWADTNNLNWTVEHDIFVAYR